MRTQDLYWLAGILEGEGAFYWRDTPTIALQMTDADVVARAAAIMRVKLRNPWRSKLGNRRLVHHFAVCGTRAAAWLMTLYTLLGERRRTKVLEIIQRWKAMPNVPRAPRGQRFMAICHPGRVRAGHGLCDSCYMRQWRANRKGTA